MIEEVGRLGDADRAGGLRPEPAEQSRPKALIPDADRVVGYRRGQCRNNENALSHTYAMTADGELWPMCGYGWNRSDGDRFSIFRSAPGSEGDCKLCRKNVAAGKQPVFDGFPHKTRWL
jgi:hypothetical protein